MMVRGDEYYMAVCNRTGTIAIYNEAYDLFMSPMLDGPIRWDTGTQESLKLSLNGSASNITASSQANITATYINLRGNTTLTQLYCQTTNKLFLTLNDTNLGGVLYGVGFFGANNYATDSLTSFQPLSSLFTNIAKFKNDLGSDIMSIRNDGGISIGSTAPVISSIVSITSTTKGFLMPRMTQAQISLIATPTDGLQVYNTDLHTICFYDGGAARWERVSHSVM
jgi:hypothetical protein